MRPAKDVIDRLLHDSTLGNVRDHIVVGYEDRFLGTVTRPFMDFDWSDYASLDPFDRTVVAIPQHRITFFRYKTTDVWNRPQRIDRVFSKESFIGVIQEIDMMNQSSLDADTSSATAS